jgi:hypothetical protein
VQHEKIEKKKKTKQNIASYGRSPIWLQTIFFFKTHWEQGTWIVVVVVVFPLRVLIVWGPIVAVQIRTVPCQWIAPPSVQSLCSICRAISCCGPVCVCVPALRQMDDMWRADKTST